MFHRLIRILILTALFSCSCTNKYEKEFRDARELYWENKYLDVYKIFFEIAQYDNEKAQYYLGEMYFEGNGVEKDIKTAYAMV